jgi:hypothetical protein
MRRFAENNGDAWFILSAEYGLLAPESLVDPYERTLRQMSPADRSAWAARVNGQIDQHVPNDAAVAILAGAHYRALIEPFLRKRGNSVHVPMEGMRIGEQLRWLGESA